MFFANWRYLDDVVSLQRSSVRCVDLLNVVFQEREISAEVILMWFPRLGEGRKGNLQQNGIFVHFVV